MGWRDLLPEKEETVIFPWVGGRSLRFGSRTWKIQGALPDEHGWYAFRVVGRNATLGGPSGPVVGMLDPYRDVGYLVGDHFVSDSIQAQSPAQALRQMRPVKLVELGLDRFARVSVGRAFEGGPLIYMGLEFPLGPEEQVLQMFLDQAPTVREVKGVTPALEAAFQVETWQRVETERLRIEAAERRRLAEEQRRKEEQRQQILNQLGDAVGRRQMAQVDFAEAAKASLAVGGATYLDHRRAVNRNEMIVRFRFMNRRFECVCDEKTLQIIDSGVCLTAHNDDDGFDEGVKGDRFFTLESLPSVLREAEDLGRLVVYRHVDG